MKKILLGVFALLFLTFAACKKDAFTDADTQATELTSDLTDDGYTYIDDANSFDEEKEAVELDTRATQPFSITSITASDTALAADLDGCTTHKFLGLARAKAATFTIAGVGFGATKGSSVLQAFWTKDTANKFTVTVSSWSATSIAFTVGGVADTMKNFSMKVRLTNPLVGKDSTAASPTKFVSKTKSKTVKCIGTDASGNSNTYGSSPWELDKQRAKLSKTVSATYTTADIDTTVAGTHYVPVAGDILEKTAGKKGIVISVTAGTNGFQKILVWQRNSLCTGALKTSTWSYKLSFTPKTDETSSTTWTKFAH